MNKLNLPARIIILLIILLIPINIFNLVFSDITLNLSYFLLKALNLNPSLTSNSIIINNYNLIFIPACVASSAYYLLTALIFLTRNLTIKKMLHLFIFGSLVLLIANIIRIDILIIILLKYGNNYFEKLHLFFWKILSSIFVALTWIFLTYTLRIKTIPVYSDLIHLIKKIR